MPRSRCTSTAGRPGRIASSEKERLWDWFKATPPPQGYDPGLFFPKAVAHESFGALRLDPWRVELWSLADLMQGKPPQVWKA